MNRKIYSITDWDLVEDWADKWLAFIELINNVTGTDQPPDIPDECSYISLRQWFLDNQDCFIKLWRDFIKSRDLMNSDDSPEEELPEKYSTNPFLLFYEADNLYRMAHQLEIQCSNDVWEPSERYVQMIRPLYIRLGQLMIEFMDWIDEQSDIH